MENQADVALDKKIANSDFDESSLIEIKVPLNSPYLSDYFSEFDRYVGELEIDGVHYKYVKRKIINGELVLFCLPNTVKTDLQNSREEFFKLVNDLNHSRKQEKSNASSFKGITIEYQEESNSWFVPSNPLVVQEHVPFSRSFVHFGYNNLPERPPKV